MNHIWWRTNSSHAFAVAKKYIMKEIRENSFLHDLYYGFPAPSQEYDHTSAFMYPAMQSQQHFEQFKKNEQLQLATSQNEVH